MTHLQPGKASRTSTSGRPIMVLLELLGRKQTLRILWELKDGPGTFRALQDRCGGISPTMLNRRLADLRGASIVIHIDKLGYELTAEGKNLLTLLGPLNGWALRWSGRVNGNK